MDGSERLTARPAAPPSAAGGGVAPGLGRLSVGGPRDSYLFVPAGYDPDRPAPLMLLLHGAGGHAHDGLRVLLHLADAAGLVLVAPASHAATWDIIAGRRYGPDRDLVDRALTHAFEHVAVDEDRIGIGGFSDGASYALSLGLGNGDLFTHVLAFSPGFIGPGRRHGRPRVFVSHGTRDAVLPIDPCSRGIARRLRAEGADLTYREFDGGHTIPPVIVDEAVGWFAAP
jgi:phospholipase/carboxylesterase